MSSAITADSILESWQKMWAGIDKAAGRDRSVAMLLCAPGALERAGVPKLEPKPGEELMPFTVFGFPVIETDALMPLPRPPVAYRGRPLAWWKRRLRKKLARRLPWVREEELVFGLVDEFNTHLAATTEDMLGRLFR